MSDDLSSRGHETLSWVAKIRQVFSAQIRDRDQLLIQLRDAHQRSIVGTDALQMIEGALQVTEMQVRDVMIPRAQMAVIPKDAQKRDILPIIIESGHSRFPVIGEDKDEVEGILLAKDMLRYFADDHESFHIRDVIRPASVIPESKRLNVLLKDFRRSRNHMAVVVDEYGGTAGLITIEDVLEQIVGEIDDEHDSEEDSWIKDLGDKLYTVKALTPIDEFNDYFTCNLTGDYDTISGVIAAKFGRIPARGETIKIHSMQFTILHSDTRRIHLLELCIDS